MDGGPLCFVDITDTHGLFWVKPADQGRGICLDGLGVALRSAGGGNYFVISADWVLAETSSSCLAVRFSIILERPLRAEAETLMYR